MSALPQGWQHAELDELRGCEPNAITDGPYGSNLKSSHYSSQGARVVRLGNIGAGMFLDHDIAFVPLEHFERLQKHRVFADDIVVAALGDPIGRACILPEMPEPALVKADCFRFRTSAEISSKYVMFWLNSEQARQRFFARSHGLGRIRINLSDFRGTTMPVAPPAEQRRIVAKIDSLTGKSKRARDHLDHVPRLVEKYKQAVLAAAFKGDLLGSPAPLQRTQLGQLAARITKGASPNWQGFDYQEEGVLFVRSQNIGWGELLMADKTYLPPSFNHKQKNSVIEENDVLLNIVGASIGRTAVANSELVGANCNQAVALIRLKEPRLWDALYVNLWLRSDEAQAAITSGSVDFARANFSLGSIRELSLSWPSGTERREIVRRVQTAFAWIERLASEATSARRLIDRLDQSVLAKAFRGELVPQDPADEPACALLERIKAEHGAASGVRRGHAHRKSGR